MGKHKTHVEKCAVYEWIREYDHTFVTYGELYKAAARVFGISVGLARKIYTTEKEAARL